MDTKIWVLLTVATLVQSRDLSEGLQNGGSKIFSENKKANPAIWRQMDNITISGEEGTKINRIHVTDLRDEKDGEARIVDGGIGKQNVTIELKSPTALRGYDFQIEVFANSDNGEASAGHDGIKQANPTKFTLQGTAMNANPSVPLSFSKDEPSSPTSDQPHEESINGKRQNRDTENKDNSNKQLNHSHSFTDVNTAVPELKSTGNPTFNKDKREDHTTPLLSKAPEHGVTNQPRIHLQETNKTPESTARSIPSTELKITEEKHHQESHDNFKGENKELSLNEKVANNYPQFNVREVTPDVLVKSPFPTVENGHKRHARDVSHNTQVVENTEQPKPASSLFRNQGHIHSNQKNGPNNQAEGRHLENDHSNQSEINVRNVETKQNKENVHVDKVEVKTIREHQNHNANQGRYIPDRFARNPANSVSANSETYTESNKISTPTIVRAKTTYHFNVNSEHSTSQNPAIISNSPTTNKPETVTGTQVNTYSINSDQYVNTNNKRTASEEVTGHIRVTRDTSDKNIKGHPSGSLTDHLKDSPASAIKPETNAKDINESKVNSDHLKTPIEVSSEKNSNKHDTKTIQEEKDMQRNTRDAVTTENKINTLSSSTTSNPEHKDQEEQKHVEVPSEDKVTNQAHTSKPGSKDAMKENERMSRDVSDVEKSMHTEASSTEVTTTDIKKVAEKSNDKSVKIEKKSLVTDEKNSNKAEKDKRETPTTVPSNIEVTEKSDVNSKFSKNSTQETNGDVNGQSGKFARDIKKTDSEGTRKPSIEGENTSKSGSNNTNKPSTTNEKKVEEPKQPKKSLTPPQ